MKHDGETRTGLYGGTVSNNIMRKLTYIVILIQLIAISCDKVDNELIEWNKIKNERDFSSFFNFALETNDSLLLSYCVDSLEKYKPENSCLILKMYDYYSESDDSLSNSRYFLFDRCDYLYDIKDRNIVFINIDSADNVKTVYSDSSYLYFNKLLFSLFDTTGDSYRLPEFILTKFNENEYQARRLVTYISCEMSPDTLNKKTTWNLLIKTNKQVIETYENIRNHKSREIFSKEFKELSEKERKLIINLVPIFIENYFYYSFINIPPPPPPPSNDSFGSSE
ncbi:MAG: hypothetical protein KQH79_11505 [Bacteroidetes bacterium]|nr:hypothetical protein [Bacteroidota bacterium]